MMARKVYDYSLLENELRQRAMTTEDIIALYQLKGAQSYNIAYRILTFLEAPVALIGPHTYKILSKEDYERYEKEHSVSLVQNEETYEWEE